PRSTAAIQVLRWPLPDSLTSSSPFLPFAVSSNTKVSFISKMLPLRCRICASGNGSLANPYLIVLSSTFTPAGARNRFGQLDGCSDFSFRQEERDDFTASTTDFTAASVGLASAIQETSFAGSVTVNEVDLNSKYSLSELTVYLPGSAATLESVTSAPLTSTVRSVEPNCTVAVTVPSFQSSPSLVSSHSFSTSLPSMV